MSRPPDLASLGRHLLTLTVKLDRAESRAERGHPVLDLIREAREANDQAITLLREWGLMLPVAVPDPLPIVVPRVFVKGEWPWPPGVEGVEEVPD